MPDPSVGGKLKLRVNGEMQYVKGSFTFNIGGEVKNGIVGHDTVHGFTRLPQLPFIEGPITFHSDCDLEALKAIENETITAELANGRTLVFRNAWAAGDWQGTTAEGEVNARFEAKSCKVL
jgi:hypothetical protein